MGDDATQTDSQIGHVKMHNIGGTHTSIPSLYSGFMKTTLDSSILKRIRWIKSQYVAPATPAALRAVEENGWTVVGAFA